MKNERPLLAKTIGELKTFFESNSERLEILEELQKELTDRKTVRAKLLSQKIEEQLDNLKNQVTSDRPERARPLFSHSLDHLANLYENNYSDAKVLEELQLELQHRSTRGAKKLLTEISNSLRRLNGPDPLRPFFESSLQFLKNHYENNYSDETICKAIQLELKHRSTKGAKKLELEISRNLKTD